MSAKSLLQDLLGELADLHEQARGILSNDIMRNAIVRDLGGTPGTAAPQFPPAGLQSVKDYRDASEPGLDALLSAIQDFRTFHDALSVFGESLNLGTNAAVEEGYRALLDVLGWNLVRLRYPKLYFFMQMFSFAEDTTSPFPGQYSQKYPFPTAVDRVISSIMDLGDFWSRTDFDSEAGTRRITDSIVLGSLGLLKVLSFSSTLKKLIKEIPGDNIIYGFDRVPGVPPPDPPTPAADTTLNRAFTINFVHSNRKKIVAGTETDPVSQNLVTTLALLPRTQGGPGLFASFGGGVDLARKLSTHWYLNAEMQCAGEVNVLVAAGPKFKFHGPDEGSDFRGVLALEARPDPADGTGKAFNLQIATNTGLSAELVRIEGTLTQKAMQLRMQMLGAVATLSPDSFDNFIAKILPKDGLRVDFDLGFGIASDRGFFPEGQVRSAGTGGNPRPTTPPPPGVQPPPLPPLPPETGPGFGLRIPIGKSLGFLTIHDLQLRFGSEDVDGKSTYLLQAASSISTKLGPVMARVDRLGLKFGVRIPDEGEKANLGFADLDVGAVLPNGVSLAIDAKGVVSGGGFLFHDKVQELYAGVLQLSLRERITVKAFGLIATKMADGSKGYSLIVFITAEDFQPIPIGMACTLRGIGGMIAINRTFSADAMREGLKNKTLGTLLFPKDPIRNAPEIIRNLVTTFPAEEDSYLVGVLMKLGWFSPTLVYLDIAIMVEFGKRMRVIVLGMISALLPTRENDLVRLNMDAMGILDMIKGSVEIDAVLVDSRLAHKFVLTGSMALRANLIPGRSGGFIMALGGVNPRFVPPLSLPKLARITIALASGNNPRLTCEAYFAITSNTIQFGARAQLYAAAYGFSVEGEVGFDVLVQLLPFHLIADFKASVQLKRGSRNLFKLSVAGTLEGPRPLRISGKASFEIFWCDFTIRFDKTLIEGEKPPLPPAVDVLAELNRTLALPDSWSTQLPANRQHGVSLRKASSTVLVLDPLGTLVVKQQIVPLNTARDLDTFGGAPIAGARRFQLQARIEGVTQDVNPIRDAFAPAQFFAMTDDEKLASPSFEDMDAGVVFGSDAVVIDDGASLFAPLEFETIIIDEEGRRTQEEEDRYILIADRLFEQVRFSAVATAPLRRVGMARFRNVNAGVAVKMQSPQFMVASTQDGSVAPAAKPVTFVEAQAALTKLNRGDTAAAWQIVPAHEMAGT